MMWLTGVFWPFLNWMLRRSDLRFPGLFDFWKKCSEMSDFWNFRSRIHEALEKLCFAAFFRACAESLFLWPWNPMWAAFCYTDDWISFSSSALFVLPSARFRVVPRVCAVWDIPARCCVQNFWADFCKYVSRQTWTALHGHLLFAVLFASRF